MRPKYFLISDYFCSSTIFPRYNNCHAVNLNGYNYGPGGTPYAKGIVWHSFSGYYNSLESVEMAIIG